MPVDRNELAVLCIFIFLIVIIFLFMMNKSMCKKSIKKSEKEIIKRK